MVYLFSTGRGGERRYCIPDEVRDLAGQPLYIVAAFWGLRCSKILTTELIGRTFCIPPRQSGDLLHYMEHEGAGFIRYERVPLIGSCGRPRRALRILDVHLPPAIPGKKKTGTAPLPPVPVRRYKTKTEIQRLRQWMTIRKPGESVPQELIAKAE